MSRRRPPRCLRGGRLCIRRNCQSPIWPSSKLQSSLKQILDELHQHTDDDMAQVILDFLPNHCQFHPHNTDEETLLFQCYCGLIRCADCANQDMWCVLGLFKNRSFTCNVCCDHESLFDKKQEVPVPGTRNLPRIQ